MEIMLPVTGGGSLMTRAVRLAAMVARLTGIEANTQVNQASNERDNEKRMLAWYCDD